jgi:hypothetical protein
MPLHQLSIDSQIRLCLKPSPGRTFPRLWVRSLAVWEAPGKKPRRSVELKPGLNIIWTPDPTEDAKAQTTGLPQGAGKTTFCRLLRYCLGEDSFGTEADERAIRRKLEQGFVGAEILINSDVWAVIRPFKSESNCLVWEGWSLMDAAADLARPRESALGRPTVNIGDSISKVITEKLLGQSPKLMPAEVGEAGAWGAALAWISRDSKCAFTDHLDWRHPKCESKSLVTNIAIEKRAMIVRALLGALSLEERERYEKREKLIIEGKKHQDDIIRLDAEIKERSERISKRLQVSSATPPDLQCLRDAVDKLYPKSRKRTAKQNPDDLETRRRERDDAIRQLAELKLRRSTVKLQIEEKKNAIAQLGSLGSDWRTCSDFDIDAICPAAGVSIRKALSCGCLLSQPLNGSVEKAINATRTDLAALENELPQLEQEIKEIEEASAKLITLVGTLEITMSSPKSRVAEAERVHLQIDELEKLIDNRKSLDQTAEKIRQSLDTVKMELTGMRKSSSDVLQAFSLLFDAIIRDLLPGDIVDKASLSGNELRLQVKRGSKTLADGFEAVKVLAFDLAAVALSIEKDTFHPGFLIHDSPHVADFGNSIYHRLFHLVQRMETFGEKPLFQYIITTTTKPPKDVCRKPWLIGEFYSSPLSSRFLTVDLEA